MRRGDVAQGEVLAEISDLEAQTRRALAESELPERPDTAAINRFLADAYHTAWAEGLHAQLAP